MLREEDGRKAGLKLKQKGSASVDSDVKMSDAEGLSNESEESCKATLGEAKKVNLTDVGIVGGLSIGVEEKDKGLPNSLYMGRAMGTGSGLGKSTGFTTSATTDMDDFFSSLGGPQNQYGLFQK